MLIKQTKYESKGIWSQLLRKRELSSTKPYDSFAYVHFHRTSVPSSYTWPAPLPDGGCMHKHTSRGLCGCQFCGSYWAVLP